MESPELIILDVGHGNCALLRDTHGTVLIDCPPGSVLPEALNDLGIEEIAHVLISHADQDHIAGLPQLLLNENVKINNIHLNSDWLRDTEIWRDVCVALGAARRRSGIKIEAQLTTATTGRHNAGQITIRILAPVPELAIAGVGGRDLSSKRLHANSMSAVVCLEYNAKKVAILAGDLDQIGLDNLVKEGTDIKADILVFPHHGGRPGSRVDCKSFAQQLCSLVKPQLVIFSIDRNRHSNPNNEIVAGVLSVVPETHIVCTQLSKQCSADLPDTDFNHLTELPAKGQSSRHCCGGSIVIRFSEDATTYTPSFDSHAAFIANFPDSLCRRFVS